MLEYLIDPDAVAEMLAPYPTLTGLAQQMRLRPSDAHPDTRWRVGWTRFAAFLAKGAGASDPHPRLRIIENAMTVSPRQQFVSTTSEPDHLSALAELLLVDALDQAGFIFHDLPLDPTARRTNALPDVMGTMPGLGTVCVEVYQPRDELVRAAYAEELHDAVELADLPVGYVSGLSWSSSQGVGALPGARVRHQRIASWLAGLAELVRSAPSGSEVEAAFRDDEAGIACDVRLSAIEAWDNPGQRPYRQTVGSWGEMWSMPAHAASVASRLESKGNRRQAVSRLADQRLLIIDCSAMRSFWDLAISPHPPSIDIMCDALEERRDSIMRGLDGLVMWAPYILAGERRRVVLAAQETSPELITALAGVAWEPIVARGRLTRLDSGTSH